MGFPSYAHPIIGEWVVPVSLNWLNPTAVEYPTTEYFKFPIDSVRRNSSPNLSKLLTLSDLTEGSKIVPLPAGVILIDGDSLYPIPALTTLTSVIWPFDTIGRKRAPTPVPKPTTSKSGGEKYSVPESRTSTDKILPPDTIAFNSARFPFLIVMVGFFSKFTISDP